MQAAARGKAPFVQSVAPKGARGIAIHNFSAARGHTPLGAYRNLFARAQHAINYTIPRLTRFFGTPSPSASVAKPQLQMKLQETIRGRMSMSTRVALSRPLKAGGMPRPPMVPRPMHEVGLGTARKFSSQTAFHHIVQKNTSITARAFWEADWDLKAADERRVTANAKYRGSSVERKTTSSRARRMAEDMSLYFPEAVQPAVTTYLQIALAPTPSNAMPLVADEDALYLLPLRTILNTHASFQARAEDVAAIFAVLDEACVWNRGASVESWGDTQGLCVELRVKFDGWTELSVRQLLGPLLDTPSCSLQEFLSSSPIPSILAIDESVDSICSPAPLEFVMPQSFVTHEEPEASSVLSRSSSATFSFASDLDHLEVSSNNLFDYLSDTLSHHSSDSDEWQTSASYVTEARTPAMVLSLSSAFLSRLEDSHSVWSAEQYALYANMRTL